MATISWLEQDLDDLDEAEQFIYKSMSDFIPGILQKEYEAKQANGVSSCEKEFSAQHEVTRTLPKSGPNVSKIPNQVIEDFKPQSNFENTKRYKFPSPTPTFNVLKPNITQTATDISPSPTSYIVGSQPSNQNHYPAIPKASPPPILPKPSRSSQFPTKTGVGNVMMQFNKRDTSPEKIEILPLPPPPNPSFISASNSITSENTSLKKKMDLDLPPPDPSFSSASDSFPPPPSLVDDFFPPPPSPISTVSNRLPSKNIPKNIEKNSMDELDFLTNNLLLNMDNPKDEDFYGYCETCGGVVEGENVGCKAMGKIYHIKCFTCTTCNDQLHGSKFYVVDQKPFCEKCYLASLEKCTVCSQLITERILRAKGKPFHPACFVCSVCNKVLDGVPFTIDDSEKIYCVDCYHEKFAFRCSVCNLPILPEPGKEESLRIVAMDRNFHVNCYKCENCSVQLSSDQGCYPLDDHIYCLDCNTKIVQEISA